MFQKLVRCFLACAILLPCVAFSSEQISGKVIGISDGDTIKVLTPEKKQIKIRLYGIDAPESHQPFGNRSRQFISSAIFGRQVNLEVINNDRYGRSVAIVTKGTQNINQDLVSNGLAWVYPQYCKRPECASWKQLEESAKAGKKGLWSDASSIPPWEFRKNGKKAAAQPEQPAQTEQTVQATENTESGASEVYNMVYSGNRSSRKFHSPDCRHYDCKRCTAKFKSREAAIKAGYKPCGICHP